MEDPCWPPPVGQVVVEWHPARDTVDTVVIPLRGGSDVEALGVEGGRADLAPDQGPSFGADKTPAGIHVDIG